MNEGWILFYNDAEDRWELYDNTYDLTIHCRTPQERDQACEMIRRANELAHTNATMSLDNMAFALKKFCERQLESSEGCVGCTFYCNQDTCRIGAPNYWNV